MNNQNIQKDNKKARPKFIVIMLASLVLGCVGGFLSARAGDAALTETISTGLMDALALITPWGPLAAALVLLIPAELLLRRSRQELARWDGEDEDVAEAIERRSNPIVALTNLDMLLILFFLSCIWLGDSPFDVLFPFVCFLLSFLWLWNIQKRMVELTRTMNPEKQGSVYDMKFHKKWLESCDESERRRIGEASYSAFRVTSSALMALWVLLIMGDTAFHFGPLPSFLVLTILGILQGSYLYAEYKSSRRS